MRWLVFRCIGNLVPDTTSGFGNKIPETPNTKSCSRYDVRFREQDSRNTKHANARHGCIRRFVVRVQEGEPGRCVGLYFGVRCIGNLVPDTTSGFGNKIPETPNTKSCSRYDVRFREQDSRNTNTKILFPIRRQVFGVSGTCSRYNAMVYRELVPDTMQSTKPPEPEKFDMSPARGARISIYNERT